MNILNWTSAYQYSLLTGVGRQRVSLAKNVRHEVDPLSVDLRKLLILIYFTDASNSIIKSDRCELLGVSAEVLGTFNQVASLALLRARVVALVHSV